jgi:transketolase
MNTSNYIDHQAINTLRFLSADAVQKANSGHPGLPMGAAAMAHVLWSRHLRFNPRNPQWLNRDRFILSGGHGSMLLYSLLYLSGFDLPLTEIENFRQWGSLTPGHPEYGLTPGVEATTGPLGQGFANGVGMAIAGKSLEARFNRSDFSLIDYYVYGIVTDGDLMEGVASEAASLAGHLKLSNIIYLYDDNRISIEGSTDLAFTEDRLERFRAYNWHVQQVEDGNSIEAIDNAINRAKLDPRPSLIGVRSIIGFGLPSRQGTAKAHGEPPGSDELTKAKENLGWPLNPPFYLPDEVVEYYRIIGNRGVAKEQSWCELFVAYREAYPELAVELQRLADRQLPVGWDIDLFDFPADLKGMATRVASGKVLNTFAKRIPELMGGSADLAPSNMTWIQESPAFQADTPLGKNIHFGVREHAMGAIVNGMAINGGVIPYGGTFLVFSDYMRPAVRLSGLSHYPSIWVYTHDSIGLGEDGPTHQPIEQLAALRAIPNLVVIRPADANEVIEAWKVAISRRNGPTVLVLSRQNIPTLDRSSFAPASGLNKGAYILADFGDADPQIILMGTGAEVNLIVAAGSLLEREGISGRIVSFPSWELFRQQDEEYRNFVLPNSLYRRLAVEAGVSQGWREWVGDKGALITLDHYGASAPYKVLFEEFGFTVDNVYRKAKELL